MLLVIIMAIDGLFSTSLNATYPIEANYSSYHFEQGCTVSQFIVLINGNCKSNIVCDGISYWFDCCSDFGTAVGWCSMFMEESP
jgi:hypothetical protein